MTLLVDASRWGRIEMVELLLAAGGNFTERRLHSALRMASDHDRFEVVCGLIKAGAKLDIEHEMETPLFIAVERGSADIIRELLKAGADPDGGSYSFERHPNGRRTRKGIELTPLMVAARDRRLDFVHTLLEGGANVRLCSKYGNTALTQGVISDGFAVVRTLLNAGADPFGRFQYQMSHPLHHYARSYAVYELVKQAAKQRIAAALSVMSSKGFLCTLG